eukprot:c7412_g1_i2 orf=357-1262(+)
MPRRVQCLVCRRLLSASNSSKPYHGDLDVEYAYCERCYREKVGQLEASVASYRAGARRHNEVQDKLWLLDRARRVEFLASGWKLGPELHISLPDLVYSNEFQYNVATDAGDLLFSDVLLVPADGLPIPAHKAILAGRSPVFRAMFCSCPMREAKSGVVMMEDMSGEVLAGFVGFLYKATVAAEIMQKHAAALLSVAEKYDVALLRTLCEEAIVDSIGPHNVISTLELARRFGSQVLRSTVLEVASQNMERLPALEEYQAYATKDPTLLLDLYEGLIQKNWWRVIDSTSRKRKRLCTLASDS